MKIEKVIKSEAIAGQTFKLCSYMAYDKDLSGYYTKKVRRYIILIEGANNKAYRLGYSDREEFWLNKAKAIKAFNRVKKGNFKNKESINIEVRWSLKPNKG